jgi:hypothetical protein
MLSIVFYLLSIGLFSAAADGGSFIDPNGGRSAIQGDEGCGVDPFGRPCTTGQLDTDEGNGFDPHG